MMSNISVKGVAVLFFLVVVCVLLSLFVNYSGLQPYISYPITIVTCLLVGIVGGKYVE